MKTQFRYILEKGSKKHICPRCEKKTYVRFIDTETSEYLPHQFGRCDRAEKCQYDENPYKHGYNKENSFFQTGKDWNLNTNRIDLKQKNEVVFFDFETFKNTINSQNYDKNIFIENLLKNVPFPFDVREVAKVIDFYYLGTIVEGFRKGAITFPFIDLNHKIKTIQVKQFNKENKTIGTDFLHSMIERELIKNNKPLPEWLSKYIQQDKRVSCLFGEHLLKLYPNNPIALVEAPKTAVYGSLYFGLPKNEKSLLWLAVYNKSSFTIEKMSVLKERKIFVFPDLSINGNTFNEWETKGKDFEKKLPNTKFIFSDLIEKLAPENERENGSDLADFLIKLDWRKFRKTN